MKQNERKEVSGLYAGSKMENKEKNRISWKKSGIKLTKQSILACTFCLAGTSHTSVCLLYFMIFQIACSGSFPLLRSSRSTHSTLACLKLPTGMQSYGLRKSPPRFLHLMTSSRVQCMYGGLVKSWKVSARTSAEAWKGGGARKTCIWAKWAIHHFY